MINGFLAVACATAIGLVNPPDRRGDDLEHVTGLLTLTGFYEHVATLIGARSRATDRHLIIAVADLDGYSMLLSLAGPAGARGCGDRAAHPVEQDAGVGGGEQVSEQELGLVDMGEHGLAAGGLAQLLRGGDAGTPPGDRQHRRGQHPDTHAARRRREPGRPRRDPGPGRHSHDPGAHRRRQSDPSDH